MAASEYLATALCVAVLGASSMASLGGAQETALVGASGGTDTRSAPAAMVVSRQAGAIHAVGQALDFYYSNPVTRRVRTVNQRLEAVYRPLRTAYRGTVAGAADLVRGDFHFSVVLPKGQAPVGGWPYAFFAPGILGAGRQYAALAERLARNGLAVALYDIPRLTEYDPAIRRAWNIEAEGVLRRSAFSLNHERSLGVGHSGGAALMVAAQQKLRMRGIVAVAPGWPEHAGPLVREGLRGSTPLVSIGLADDATAPAAEFARSLVRSPRDRYVEIPGARHNDVHGMFGPASTHVLDAVVLETVTFARQLGVLP